MANYTGVVGTMGAGTTSFAQSLGEKFGWEIFLEPVDSNPFLDRAYKDPKRYSLHSQLSFFADASAQGKLIAKALAEKKHCIEDRIRPEHEMFARTQFESGKMDEETYQLYRKVADTHPEVLPTPDLIIYLQVAPETAMERIIKRGRSEEERVTIKYLNELEMGYQKLVKELRGAGANVLELDWNEERGPDELVTQQVIDNITHSLFNSHA